MVGVGGTPPADDAEGILLDHVAVNALRRRIAGEVMSHEMGLAVAFSNFMG